MKKLKESIVKHAAVLSDQVVNMDKVLTHEVDPPLIRELGQAFARLYEREGVTKVATIEASGISLAFATALELNVPLVFARRRVTPASARDFYHERIPSFTKGMMTDLYVSMTALTPDDRVLVIDDMIAGGDAARGLIRIINRSGAQLAGVGVAVEKAFQRGAESLREAGIRVDALVKIVSLDNGTIRFAE